MVEKKKRPPIAKKNISIEDAKVVESVNDEENDFLNEKADNLNNQKTVNIKEEIKSNDEEEEVIDFYNEKEILKNTGSSAKEAKEDEDFGKENLKGKSKEEYEKELEDAIKADKESQTPEYFQEIAEFLITLIDTGFASAMKWWAKDTSDVAYSLSKPKQNKLIGMLTRILFKYQAKFSLEFMFFLTILVMYIPSFGAARRRRKDLKENLINNANNGNNGNMNFVKKEPEIIETVTEFISNEEKIDFPPKKKKGPKPKYA